MLISKHTNNANLIFKVSGNNNYQQYKITSFRPQNLKSSGILTYWQADGLAAGKYEKNHWRPFKGVEY